MELKAKNPNTTIKIDLDRTGDTSSLERQFKRVYVCLSALKEGFRTWNLPTCLCSSGGWNQRFLEMVS